MTKQYISFPVYSLDEKTMQGLAELSEILEKVGVLVSVDRVERPGASAYDMFRLKVNEEQYRKITTRNAGRKQNFLEKYEKYAQCTVGELKKMLNSTTKTEIARYLGCSRMTLYRIIKNIADYEPEESVSVWHYTSARS